jgi:hypothetical protein
MHTGRDNVNERLMDTAMEFNDGFRVIYPDIDFTEDSKRNRQKYLRFQK